MENLASVVVQGKDISKGVNIRETAGWSTSHTLILDKEKKRMPKGFAYILVKGIDTL